MLHSAYLGRSRPAQVKRISRGTAQPRRTTREKEVGCARYFDKNSGDRCQAPLLRVVRFQKAAIFVICTPGRACFFAPVGYCCVSHFQTIALSFTNTDLIAGTSSNIGLQNYANLGKDYSVQGALSFTIIIVVGSTALELIVGKMIPLLVLSLILIGVTLGLGVFWFGVPFKGSLWLYLWLSLLFIASSLGLGLLVSTIARNQRQVAQITQMLMIFSMLLTGLIYPRSAMPAASQFIGDLIPLTYFIRISRGIVTKGVGLAFFWGDALVLLIYGLVVMVTASFSFRNRLD